MEDSRIIELYWARSEEAITASSEKYGGHCYTIAQRILCQSEDSRECVNDTWLRAWNSIPPCRPDSLKAFLGAITRKEAEELLARGNYITGCGYGLPGMEYVAGSELVYRTGLTEAYYLPYYRFYVELPQQGRPDGMKTFAAYYVPAVAAEYIADMPLWEGTYNG